MTEMAPRFCHGKSSLRVRRGILAVVVVAGSLSLAACDEGIADPASSLVKEGLSGAEFWVNIGLLIVAIGIGLIGTGIAGKSIPLGDVNAAVPGPVLVVIGAWVARKRIAAIRTLRRGDPPRAPPVSEEPERGEWRERLRVIGKSQERYLWALVVLAVFFWALHVRMVGPEPGSDAVTLPFLGVQFLDPEVVWAAAPFLLAFVQLALFGALRAIDLPRRKLGLDRKETSRENLERFDLAPNALELSYYNTEETPRFLRVMAYLVYPLVNLLILAEAACIGIAVYRASLPSWSLVLLAAAAPLWLAAAFQVIWLHTLGRVRKLLTGEAF